MTETQDRLQERPEYWKERALEAEEQVRIRDEQLRQSQDIEAAARCDFDCDACRAEVEE